MNDGSALINLGELSKPATVLIERISDAVGGIAKPWQIKRIAEAEAEAAVIATEAELKVNELQRRGLERMIREEGKKQENIENITAKSLEHLQDDAKPEDIEEDWLTYFFEKSRICSNEEMQKLWSRLLSGEANEKGSFSRKTIEIVSQIESSDADLFNKLATFIWMIGSSATPLIFEPNGKILGELGINFVKLVHLDSLGLIRFEPSSGFQKMDLPKNVPVHYYGLPISLEFSKENGNSLSTGHVILTQSALELIDICQSKSSDKHMEDVLSRWYSEDILISLPIKHANLWKQKR